MPRSRRRGEVLPQESRLLALRLVLELQGQLERHVDRGRERDLRVSRERRRLERHGDGLGRGRILDGEGEQADERLHLRLLAA